MDGEDLEGKRKKGELWVKAGIEAALSKQHGDEEASLQRYQDENNLPLQGCLQFTLYKPPAHSPNTQPKQPGGAEVTFSSPGRKPVQGGMGIAGGRAQGHKVWQFILLRGVDLSPALTALCSCFTRGEQCSLLLGSILVSLT